MNAERYFLPLREAFEMTAIPENVVPMKAYMRNQFEFYGIRATERRTITKAFLKANALLSYADLSHAVKWCWIQPEREWQYAGLDTLLYFKKLWTTEFVTLIERLVTSKSWWDTVDVLAPDIAGQWLLKNPSIQEEVALKWNGSKNFWLQRTSIIFQLMYKQKTNGPLLFKCVENRKDSKEFFVQKAIGWALRQYSKTNRETVEEFIATTDLKPLSNREGMKWILKHP